MSTGGKRLLVYYQLPSPSLPFTFSFILHDEPSNQDCDKFIKNYEKCRTDINENRGFFLLMDVKYLKKHKKLRYARYLRDLHRLIQFYTILNNDNTFGYIDPPMVNNLFPSMYLYVFCYFLNCFNKKVFTLSNLKELFRTLYVCVFPDDNEHALFQDNVRKMIIRNLNLLTCQFFLSAEQEDKYSLQMANYVDKFNAAVWYSRHSFKNYLLPQYEHDLAKAARMSYSTNILDVTSATITSALDDSTKVVWPAVSIGCAYNFINGLSITVTMDLHIKHLAKFHSHIYSPGKCDFSLDYEKISELENKKYNEQLRFHIIEQKFSDTAGLLSIEGLDEMKFASSVAIFTYNYFNQHNVMGMGSFGEGNVSTVTNYVLDLLKKGKEYRNQVARKMAKFGFVRSVALLYQIINVNESLPVQFKYKRECTPRALGKSGFLLSDTMKTEISSVLSDTLLLSEWMEKLLIRPCIHHLTKTNVQSLFNTVSIQNDILEVAGKVVDRLVSGNSMIIQTGNPVLVTNFHSNHAFYAAFKVFDNKVTIILVNGGCTLAAFVVDSSYVVQDQGSGGHWKCRQTEAIDLTDANALEFLKQYVYKVLTLMYFHADPNGSDEWKYKNLIDNVYLMKPPFLGFGFAPTAYFPVISNNPQTFKSQVFDNCTVYNLQNALEILFEMNELERSALHHQIMYSFSYLLHQNDAALSNYKHGLVVIPPTVVQPDVVQPEAGSLMIDYF